MYRRYIKRLIDIGCSLLGMIITLPVYLVISFGIQVSMGKPILFKQKRISKGNKSFTIYKFRTMRNLKDEEGILLENKRRLTKFGSFLRSSSLDEIPELFNVLKGDMSIIGPRPLPPEYLPFYTQKEMQRHRVRGGIIPPEVLYKNVTPTWKQQFKYEVHYADNVSFLLDFRIMLATLRAILKRNHINYAAYSRISFTDERMKGEKLL